MTSAVCALASSASGRLMTKTRGESLSVESISSGRVSQGDFSSSSSGVACSTTLLRLSKVFFSELVAGRSVSRVCICVMSFAVLALNLVSGVKPSSCMNSLMRLMT